VDVTTRRNAATKDEALARINALVAQREALEREIDAEVIRARDLRATFDAIGRALGGAGRQSGQARHKAAQDRQRGR
jgi:hypothetical protein